MNRLKPRDAVLKMAPYSPPTGGRIEKMRLDFNENTVGASPAVLRFLHQRLDENALSVYPEYGEAKKDLASYFCVKPEELLLTNGTDEAIQVLINTYVDDGNDVLLLKPSYAMYRFYAEVAGASVREVSYCGEDLAFPLDTVLQAIRPDTRAVLIANPNNPTGTAIGLEAIRSILERAPDAAVLIDEAYFEFFGVTALGLLGEFPNLFVSRTFSKVFGMAAMRMGCLFSQAQNVAYMHKAQSPYSVNTIATMAAQAAIRDTDYVKRYVSEALEARTMIYEGLNRLGIGYVASEANFVLFRVAERAIEVRDKLRATGVLVRDRSYELPGCVRVTCGTKAQAKRFLDELERIWKSR